MAAFHAGQDEIKLFYYNPVSQKVEFTDTTLRQTPCAIPKKSSKAQLRDYWQFSRNIASTTNCNRSGINITKDEFRKLGARITAYLATNERKIYDRVRVSIGANLGNDNLFESLSYFLISSKAPSGHSAAKIKEITESWVAMLTYMTDESKAITKDIETNSR